MRKCRVCDVELTEANTHHNKIKQHRICKVCENERVQQKDQRCKLKTILEYGGKCACCGETEVAFLSIDHISGNGAEERKTLNKSGGPKFYRWLKRQGYPKDNYQVLCFNCNFAKHTLGKCPHRA